MKYILLILFLIGLVSPLQANDSYYYFKQISIKEGLPSSVTTIYDDEDGFLWIGTIYGIYRFDGEKLTKPHFSDTQQMSSYTYSIAGDSEGHIWGFTDKGVSLYNNKEDTFEPFLMNGKPIKAYNVLSDEDYILFPVQGELLRYDKHLKSCNRLTLQHQDKQLLLFKIEVYDAEHYIGLTYQHTLILINRNTGETQPTPFANTNPAWDFHCDFQNRYWISCYGKGIVCYTKEGKLIDSYTPQNSGLNNVAILEIEERNQQIWLATDGGGINIINPDTRQVTVLSSQGDHNFPANSVTCLNNGANNMWVGMVREGVLGAKENFITTYTKSPENSPYGMSEKCPLCLIEDADGILWIGTDGGGVNSFNPQTEKFTHYPATSEEKIVSICAYSEDELLISNYHTGVHLFNKKTGTYRKFIIADEVTDNSLTSTSMVVNLFANQQGEIEFHGKGYYRYNKKTKQFIPLNVTESRYAGPWIYIGTYQSKNYFHNQNCIFRYNYQSNEVEPISVSNDRHIIAASLDQTGKVWIANRNNLSCLTIDTNEMEVIKLPDNNDLVTSLVIDRQGVIWMGTPGALYSYSPRQKHFVIFSESDGVLPNDFLPKPVLITHDNNVYMGGAMGLVRVNQALNQQKEQNNTLRIKLLDVRLNGSNTAACCEQDIPSLEIPSSFTLLEVHTKLDGTDLFRKRIYRFQIEGLNNDYTESSKSHLSLRTLPPGDYRIHAQCTMANGLWSDSFTLLHLTVLPPWWQRSWFIASVALLVLAALAYVVHLREVRIQRELKEKERQIYKDKVQALININHELRTPLTLIYSPLKQLLNSKQMPHELRNKLQGVLKQTRQMKNIINMILNIRRMEVGQNTLCLTPTLLNEWLQTIVNDFKNEFEMRNISLTFHPDPQIDTISCDTNQCEIIINNLLMNAYKFNNPGATVTVATHLEENKDFIRIEISGNGTDSSNEDFPKLGLSYTKQLVEMHGGQINAKNKEEGGDTFYFTLPIHQEFVQTTCPVRPYLNDFLSSNATTRLEEQTAEPAKFYSILIVESDPDLCDFMTANLQSIFEKTYIAHDGMEALPIIVSHLPQLIISDVALPRISGLELCRKVKQNPETSFIPVVLLAPDMDELNAEDGYKTGADAYIAKPFDMDLLMIQVQNILNNRNIVQKHYLPTAKTSEILHTKTNNYVEEQFVSQLNKAIADNLSNTELDVNMVAKLMYMSRASLYNKMKVIIGTGVNEYITKQRIELAQKLLIETNLSVREVSEKTGFLHQRNFSVIFKKVTGVSPTEYRKNLLS